MYILLKRSSCGNSRIHPSWPCSEHGLNPALSMHLVATPNPVYNCLWQWVKFHPNVFCYLGGFSLMYKQTSQQRYMIQGTHLYTSHCYYYSCSSLHIFPSPGQAGCLPFSLSATCPLITMLFFIFQWETVFMFVESTLLPLIKRHVTSAKNPLVNTFPFLLICTF